MGLYRKKPVTIEAKQWFSFDTDEETHNEIISWLCDNEIDIYLVSPFIGDHALMIKTLEGYMEAEPGDWIIKGVAGEFYPCKPDIFEATYEKIEIE